RSPPEVCSQTVFCSTPIELTNERPSGKNDRPCSSVAPAVTCSGTPSGNRWRQMWKPSPALAEKYIHAPSGDQVASVHGADGGPTTRAADPAFEGTSLQGSHAAAISTTSTHRPSGDANERCAMSLTFGGAYTGCGS